MSEPWAKIIAGGIVGAVIGGAATLGGTYYTVHKQQEVAHPGIVRITQPQPSRQSPRVSSVVKVGGSAEIPHDLAAETWIVVRVDVNGAGTYYPQGYAVPDPSGSWTCTITLGSPSRAEDGQYAVLAVLAAPKTSQAFQSYVKTQLATSVNGMSDYPADGVDVKDSVALTRDSAVLPTVVKQKEGTCK